MKNIGKNSWLLTAFTSLTFTIFAQTSEIHGKCTEESGNPVENVHVEIINSEIDAKTSKDGVYQLKMIPAGTYQLMFSAAGFDTIRKTVQLKPEPLKLDVTLHYSIRTIQEISVIKSQNRYNSEDVSPSLRLETPILEIPQNIQVITSQALADQQVTDMLEGATRNVSGVTRQEHWENYALMYGRGSQLTAFRNGMNVQMPWGPLAEDMSMVDRIEVVKGPAGFMLANGEPSGFYNVVTKKPTGKQKGEATMMLGSFNTYRSTLDLDGFLSKNKKLTYRLNLMGQMKNTQREFEFSNRVSIAPVVRYQISDKTYLTAEYTYQYMKSSPLGSAYAYSPNGYGEVPASFTTLENNLDPTTINDQSIFLTLNHQLSKNWKLTAQMAYLRYNQVGSSLWPSSIDSAGNLDRGISIWDALGQSRQGQVFVNGDLKTGFIRHRILGGLDMNHKDYYADWSQFYSLNGSTVFNVFNPVYGTIATADLPVFDRSKSIRERGVYYGQGTNSLYVQDELGFLENKIRLTIAGRYTHSTTVDPYSGSTDDEKFTPRFGLSVSILKSLTAYALYDVAYVPQAGFDYEGNTFDPITGDNIEFGLKKDWFNGKWRSSVSMYQITKNNVLTSDPEHINFSVQLGQTKTKGIEFDLTGQLAKGLDLILNYAYTDGKISKDSDPTIIGNQIAGTAKHVANAWLSYHITKGIFRGLGASIGFQYQTDRSSWYVFDGSVQRLPNYFRMDGSIFYQANKLRLGLNINNITNEYLYSGANYYGMYYYYQIEALRNYRLSLSYSF